LRNATQTVAALSLHADRRLLLLARSPMRSAQRTSLLPAGRRVGIVKRWRRWTGRDRMADGARSTAVVGGSGTIGAALVARLVADGDTVHVLARTHTRDRDPADEVCRHEVDVRVPEQIYRELEPLAVDALIYCAGLGSSPRRLDAEDKTYINELVDVNTVGVLHAMRAVLPGMVQAARGHIINVGSVAGSYPVGATAYAASKAAVAAATANLRLEFQGSGIRFTEIRPGRVHSQLFERAGGSEYAHRQQPAGVELLRADDVASAIMFALNAPPHVNVSLIELASIHHLVGGSFLESVDDASRRDC
jgi:NADP-dependent 3-hydroxy acid dehydrogenase YdfG